MNSKQFKLLSPDQNGGGLIDEMSNRGYKLARLVELSDEYAKLHHQVLDYRYGFQNVLCCQQGGFILTPIDGKEEKFPDEYKCSNNIPLNYYFVREESNKQTEPLINQTNNE